MRRTPDSLVLGAGVTGLAAAWKLAESGRAVEVLELSDRVGGMSRTFRWGDSWVDTGPHKLQTGLPGILDAVRGLLGAELLTVPKKSGLFVRGRLLDYPLDPAQVLGRLSPVFALRAGLSWLWAQGARGLRADRTYEDWVVKRFGRTLYGAAFEGLAEKVWGDPRRLSADLARRRIATPGLWALAKALLDGRAAPAAQVFHYPRAGISRLSEAMRDRVAAAGGAVSLSQEVSRIRHARGRVFELEARGGSGTRTAAVRELVSTIPLARLFSLLDPAPPESVVQAAAGLRLRPALLAYLELRTPRLLRDTWIFFPEKRCLFSRVSEQKGFSASMCPPDRTVLCLDIGAAHPPGVADWPDRRILDRCVGDLKDCGLLGSEPVLRGEVLRIPDVYPVYDLEYRARLEACLGWLGSLGNLFTVGRSGLFCYNNIDQCLDMAFRLAAHVSAGRPARDWLAQRSAFDAYEIVD